jgi:phosphopentomutase
VDLGLRRTLSDVGATVCDFFGVKAPQNGESFLELLK